MLSSRIDIVESSGYTQENGSGWTPLLDKRGTRVR